MHNIKGYSSKAKGLSDLLPYAALIDPGIVLNKDCSLMAAWEFRGLDTASSTMEDLDQVVFHFNHATLETGTGLMLHVDAVRKPVGNYPAAHLSHFPDAITKMIEDERREFFQNSRRCFQTNTILTVTYKVKEEIKSNNFSKYLADFKEKLEKLETVLGVLPDFVMERLLEYEVENEYGRKQRYSPLLSHLQQCITGDLHPILVPDNPMYLDAILGGQDFTGGVSPKIGDKFIKVLSIDSLPSESYPAMLQFMDALPVEYRFSTRFICLDTPDAVKEINFHDKGWSQNIVTPMDKYFDTPNPKINMDAMLMADDAKAAKLSVMNGEVRFGYLTTTVILMDEDQDVLKESLKLLVSEFNSIGFVVRIEKYNAQAAWMGSLPGHWKPNERRPLVHTVNLAHMLPLASVWPGFEICPNPMYPANAPPLMVCLTDGTTPFRLNLHYGDIGHTLIFGPTGSGKSTLLAMLAAQFRRYKNSQIYAFDKGMSMFPLTLAAGGTHYDLGEGGFSFAPFQWLNEGENEIAWVIDWLETLFTLQGLILTPGHMEALNQGVRQLKNMPAHMRNMTHLHLVIPDNELKLALNYYTESGACGRMWEAASDSFAMSDFMTIEIESLMQMGPKFLLPALLYVFHRIEKGLTGNPAVIILDEAWLMLAHPVFREKIREWLKVLRKANCAVILATQSLSDADRSGIMDVLSESCPTKIFLANFSANQENQRHQYIGLGLNSRQIQIITNAAPKRDYYVTSPAGRRLVQLAIGKKALAFTGASSRENIVRIKQLYKQYEHDWPEVWLAERNIA